MVILHNWIAPCVFVDILESGVIVAFFLGEFNFDVELVSA